MRYDEPEKKKETIVQEKHEYRAGPTQTWKEAYPNEMPPLSELPGYAYEKLKKYLMEKK